MTEDTRALVQVGTLIISVIIMIECFVVIRWRLFPWRYVVWPVIVFAEIILFYSVLIIIGPLFGFSIGRYANFISAVIRFQGVAVVMVYLSFAIYKTLKGQRVFS